MTNGKRRTPTRDCSRLGVEWLGREDLNPQRQYQKLLCYQLHHAPPVSRSVPRGDHHDRCGCRAYRRSGRAPTHVRRAPSDAASISDVAQPPEPGEAPDRHSPGFPHMTFERPCARDDRGRGRRPVGRQTDLFGNQLAPQGVVRIGDNQHGVNANRSFVEQRLGSLKRFVRRRAAVFTENCAVRHPAFDEIRSRRVGCVSHRTRGA